MQAARFCGRLVIHELVEKIVRVHDHGHAVDPSLALGDITLRSTSLDGGRELPEKVHEVGDLGAAVIQPVETIKEVVVELTLADDVGFDLLWNEVDGNLGGADWVR